MSGYNFKLVIMSATLQGDLFTRYFSEKKIKTIFVGVKRCLGASKWMKNG